VNFDIVSLTGDDPQFYVINEAGNDWDGYTALQMDYRINAHVRETGGAASRLSHPGVNLSRTVRVQVIPIYQYAIFYDNLLELWPGPQMDVHGKVHSNGNAYFNAENRLNLWRGVTVAGDFYANAAAPGSGRSVADKKTVWVTTDGVSNGTALNTYDSGLNAFVDSRRDNWQSEAYERWGRFLRDQSHGVLPVGLPLPEGTSPRTLIEPVVAGEPESLSKNKYDYIASLRVNGNPSTGVYTVTDRDGTIVNPSYTAPNGSTQNWISTKRIFSKRENKYVHLFDIDAAKLKQAVAAKPAVYADFSESAVLYVNATQPTGAEGGARLINASVVPQDGFGSFTFASNGPIFTKGNVNNPANAADRVLTLIAGDSVNPLSTAFNDANYLNSPQPVNTAANTTTNAIFMTGNVPSAGNVYSGGAENYFRYLENWDGKQHVFNGTLMNLWESQIAKGKWGQSSVYNPPQRVWSWDTTYQTRFPPPHFPTFWIFSNIDWTMENPTSE
jgi:hypothetical protein